ncbi:hypothetical protein DFQ28_001556, partial [Apophysomyces sp. BC1034]
MTLAEEQHSWFCACLKGKDLTWEQAIQELRNNYGTETHQVDLKTAVYQLRQDQARAQYITQTDSKEYLVLITLQTKQTYGLVDTGATISALTPQVAQELGVNIHTKQGTIKLADNS